MKMKKEIEKIIDREIEIWKSAYPEQANLLQLFINKIKLEIDLQLKTKKRGKK